MRRSILLIVAIGFLSTSALGQSINIDAGDLAGTPAATYAAAGLSGAWNTLTAGPGIPEALVGLNGRPVAATVTRDFGYALAFDDPGTVGDDQGLLDDGRGDMGDVQMTLWIDGLIDGTYEIITYAWTPVRPNDTTLVMVGNDVFSGLIAGGPWPGGLEEWVTHVVHEVEVSDGNLSIGAVGGYWGASGFINGVQLRRVTPADLDEDGMVGVNDFLNMLIAWGPCPEPCPSDLDTDGEVGINDVLILLGSWG
ncbi:MAG: hypothetical protein ACYSU7_16650 [Planctomycetota bacterium]|jgi:hypothetical protein